MKGKICTKCAIREIVVTHFDANCPPGEVGAYLDGLIEAIALIAAAHVTPGREDDERKLLLDFMGNGFDAALVVVAAGDSRGEALH